MARTSNGNLTGRAGSTELSEFRERVRFSGATPRQSKLNFLRRNWKGYDSWYNKLYDEYYKCGNITEYDLAIDNMYKGFLAIDK